MEVGTPIDEHFNSFYESDMVVGKIDAIFSAAFFRNNQAITIEMNGRDFQKRRYLEYVHHS